VRVRGTRCTPDARELPGTATTTGRQPLATSLLVTFLADNQKFTYFVQHAKCADSFIPQAKEAQFIPFLAAGTIK
jgi:hypothetical protein